MKQTVEEAAIESCVIDRSIYNDEYQPYYLDGFKDGAEWQANQSPWISVKERLPKDIPGAPLVVILEDGKTGYYNARYTDNYEFVTMDGQLLHNVAYWQPIPSFDEILEANKDVLERIKEKGD